MLVDHRLGISVNDGHARYPTTCGKGFSEEIKKFMYYRIAGKFRAVLIFVIFVVELVVTKFSTHEN